MMDRLCSNFTFYKAGQGAFYGGQIYSHELKRAWNIVYDCGTSPWIKGHSGSLSAEINRFGVSHIKTVSEIDILFISHLDYDHVSGVITLLGKYPAKRVVLPYFPEDQRRFALASYYNSGGDDGGDGSMSLVDYLSFISNPYTFLSGRWKEAEIYIVLPDDRELEYLGYPVGEPPEGIYPRGTTAQAPPELIDALGPNNFRFYRNNLQFYVQNRWEFTTYVKDLPTTKFRGLKRCLNKKLGNEEDDELGTAEISRILVKDSKSARACYKKHLSDVNAHGLVLLHGPVNFKRAQGCSFSESDIHMMRRSSRLEENWFLYPVMLDERRFVGTLLMGDTSINLQNNPVTFPPKFIAKCQNVLVFQVPHHGSHKNWDLVVYRAIFQRDWDHPVFNVCNFGYGNTYGHPSHDVVNDLSNSIVLNSQFTSFSTELNVYYN